MNEQKIRDIAGKAGLKSEIMLDSSSRDVECFVTQYNNGETPSIHNWKKFAELIVADCIKQCQIVAAQCEFATTGETARKTEAAAEACAKMIKHRFGVE